MILVKPFDGASSPLQNENIPIRSSFTGAISSVCSAWLWIILTPSISSTVNRASSRAGVLRQPGNRSNINPKLKATAIVRLIVVFLILPRDSIPQKRFIQAGDQRQLYFRHSVLFNVSLPRIVYVKCFCQYLPRHLWARILPVNI